MWKFGLPCLAIVTPQFTELFEKMFLVQRGSWERNYTLPLLWNNIDPLVLCVLSSIVLNWENKKYLRNVYWKNLRGKLRHRHDAIKMTLREIGCSYVNQTEVAQVLMMTRLWMPQTPINSIRKTEFISSSHCDLCCCFICIVLQDHKHFHSLHSLKKTCNSLIKRTFVSMYCTIYLQ
jgi:hypothetical protein